MSEKLRLRATMVVEVEYEVDPANYGTDDPRKIVEMNQMSIDQDPVELLGMKDAQYWIDIDDITGMTTDQQPFNPEIAKNDLLVVSDDATCEMVRDTESGKQDSNRLCPKVHFKIEHWRKDKLIGVYRAENLITNATHAYPLESKAYLARRPDINIKGVLTGRTQAEHMNEVALSTGEHERLHELKVVIVTTQPDAYPEYARASVKYPKLVEYVEDEAATFVVDPESGDFWPAAEFFYMHKITALKVDSKELDR